MVYSALLQIWFFIMSTITHDINLIIDALNCDEIAAIPTETVYGLAGNAQSDAAIHKIYKLKQRPLNHPLIMHVAQNADLTRWATDIPDYVETLITHFWPGPLTLVLPCLPTQVNPLVTAGQTTVAIRAPHHPQAQQLLAALDFPLVAPSANKFGKISPTTAAHVQESFKNDELLILDGGRCTIGIESTIVAATSPHGYQILRHGIIDEAMLRQVLPNLELARDEKIRVSGNLNTHYQPEKPLYYFTDLKLAKQFCASQKGVFVLLLNENDDFAAYPGHHLSNNPEVVSYELYYQLRQADQSMAEVILIELPPNTSAWQGTRERIMKAGRKLGS